MSATTKPVSDSVLALSKALQANASVVDGRLDLSQENFTKAVEEHALTINPNLNAQLVKDSQKLAQDALAALTHTTGVKGIEAMKADATLNNVGTKLKLGHDTMEVDFRRQQEIGIPPREKGGERQTKVVPGYCVTKYRSRAASNSGELKRVSTHLSELATGLASK